MPKYETRDGRVLEWTGFNICVCSKCEQVFNSVAAFDMHLRDRDGKGAHYHADMPRNAAGRLVTSLRDSGIEGTP